LPIETRDYLSNVCFPSGCSQLLQILWWT